MFIHVLKKQNARFYCDVLDKEHIKLPAIVIYRIVTSQQLKLQCVILNK